MVAAAPAVDNAEKLRLEQERKAIDEDKRKMAAQLEAMTQMLATLFEAGLPLDRALAILEELAPSPRVRTRLRTHSRARPSPFTS